METLLRPELPDLQDSHLSAAAHVGDTTITLPISTIPANCILTITAGRTISQLADAEIIEVAGKINNTYTVVKSYYHGNESKLGDLNWNGLQAEWPINSEVVVLFNSMYYDSIQDALNNIIANPHAVEDTWTFNKGIVVTGEPTAIDGAIGWRADKLQAYQGGKWNNIVTTGVPASLFLYGMLFYDPLTRWTSTDQIRTKHATHTDSPPTLDNNGEVSIRRLLSVWSGTDKFSVQVGGSAVTITSSLPININTALNLSDIEATNVNVTDTLTTQKIAATDLTINAETISVPEASIEFGDDDASYASGEFSMRQLVITEHKFANQQAFDDFNLSDYVAVTSGIERFVDPNHEVVPKMLLNAEGQLFIRSDTLLDLKSMVVNVDGQFKVGTYFKVDPTADQPIQLESPALGDYIKLTEHIQLGGAVETPANGMLQWTAENGFQGYHDGDWQDFQTVSQNLPSSSPGFTLRWQDHDWRGTSILQVHDDHSEIHNTLIVSGALKIGDTELSSELGMMRYNGDFQGYMPVVNSEGEWESYWVSLTGGGVAAGGQNGEVLVYSAEAEKWVSAGDKIVFNQGEMYMEARLRGLVALSLPPQTDLPSDTGSGKDQKWMIANPHADWPGEEAQVTGPAPNGANWIQVVPANVNGTQLDQIRVWGQVGVHVQILPGENPEDPPAATNSLPIYGWIPLNANSSVTSAVVPSAVGHDGQLLIADGGSYAWATQIRTVDDNIQISNDLTILGSTTIAHDLSAEYATINGKVHIADHEGYFSIGHYDPARTNTKHPEDFIWQMLRVERTRDDSHVNDTDKDSWEETDIVLRYGLHTEAFRANRDGDVTFGRDVRVSRYLSIDGPIIVNPFIGQQQDLVLGMIQFNGDFEGWDGSHWVSLTHRLALPQIPVPIIELNSIVTIDNTPHTITAVPTSTSLTFAATTVTAPIGTIVTFANGATATLAANATSAHTITLNQPVSLLPGNVTINANPYNVTSFDGQYLHFATCPILTAGTLITLPGGNQVRVIHDYSASTDPILIEVRYTEVEGSTLYYDPIKEWTHTNTLQIIDRNVICAEGVQVGPVASFTPNAGAIQFNGDFLGYNGQAWVSLTGYGDQTIPVSAAGTMLVSNGTIWIGTEGVTYRDHGGSGSAGVLKINNILQLEEFTEDVIPPENLVRGMVRHRGDLEYFTGNSWISLTDYYGLPGGHLPTQGINETWTPGSIIIFKAPTQEAPTGTWIQSERIIVGETTTTIPSLSTDILTINEGQIRFTGDDYEALVDHQWVSLTAKAPFGSTTTDNTIYFDGENWVATNKFTLHHANNKVLATVTGTIKVVSGSDPSIIIANATNSKSWRAGVDSSNILSLSSHLANGNVEVANVVTITSSLVTLPNLLTAIINATSINTTNITSTNIITAEDITAHIITIDHVADEILLNIGSPTVGNETHNAMEVHGLAKFDYTIVVGDQKSERPDVGMIRFHSGDFQGWDGEYWHSFTGKLQGMQNMFGVGYWDGTMFRYDADSETWIPDQHLTLNENGLILQSETEGGTPKVTINNADGRAGIELDSSSGSGIAFNHNTIQKWVEGNIWGTYGDDLKFLELINGGAHQRVTMPAGGGLIVHDGTTEVQDLLVHGSIIGAAPSGTNYYPATIGTRSNIDHHGSDAEVFMEDTFPFRGFEFPQQGPNPVYFNAIMPAEYSNNDTVRLQVYVKLLDASQTKDFKFQARVANGSTKPTGDYTTQTIHAQEVPEVGSFTIDVKPTGTGRFITVELSRNNSFVNNYVGRIALLGVEISQIVGAP